MGLSLGIGLGVTRRGGGSAADFVAPAGAAFATAFHPSCCRSDAACLVPCGPGDAMRWLRDLVTDTWYEQPTSGARLILRDAGGGKWYAEGDTGRFHSTVSGLPRVGVTLGASARGDAAGFFPMILSAGLGDRELRWQDTSRTLAAITNNGAGTVVDPTATALGVDFRAVQSCGSVTRLYRDAIEVASGADTSTANAMPALDIGGRGASLSWVGRFYAVVAYASALDAAGVAALDAWLQGYMP